MFVCGITRWYNTHGSKNDQRLPRRRRCGTDLSLSPTQRPKARQTGKTCVHSTTNPERPQRRRSSPGDARTGLDPSLFRRIRPRWQYHRQTGKRRLLRVPKRIGKTKDKAPTTRGHTIPYRQSLARHHEPILGSSGVDSSRSHDRPSLSQRQFRAVHAQAPRTPSSGSRCSEAVVRA
jgi:hypothetical protein